MMIAHYTHRLPADYDLDTIKNRARERGPLWDNLPGLYFKGFLLREKGKFGATSSSYSSLYLWQQTDRVRDFLVTGSATTTGFKGVTESFGRPQIRTWLALDARRGEADVARFVHTEELDIPTEADLTEVLLQEEKRNQQEAARRGIVAAVVGVDMLNWKLLRFTFSADEPAADRPGMTFQVLHFARPLLNDLPGGEHP